MKNTVSSGETFDVLATADYTSGVPVRLNDTVVIPVTTGKSGTVFAGKAKGAYSLPKASGTTFGQGVKVMWDTATGTVIAFTTSPTGTQVYLGKVFNAGLNGSTTVDVSINV